MIVSMDLDLSPGSLLASLLVSTIGMGLFLYGKKQTRGPQLLVGLFLMAYPYFVPNPVAMLGIGAGALGLLTVLLRAGM